MEKENHNIEEKKDHKSFIMTSFLNMFDKMSPDTVFFAGKYSRLPTFFYYLGGFFWNGGWVGLFIFFLYTSYQSASTRSFVSLQSDNGICNEVPFSVTGSYKLDNYGYWENEDEYKSALAMIITDFTAFTATNQKYSNLLTIAANRFEKISKKSMYRDLAYNLIVLASVYNISTTSGILEIQPTGNIAYMLHQKNSIIAAVYNATIDLHTSDQRGCFGTNAGAEVDLKSNTIASSFSYSEASVTCQSMANILGYDGNFGDNFNFKLDLGSFRYDFI